MEKELVEKRALAESRFNELQKEKEQKEAEVSELNTEMVRLQGEARLLDELLNKKPEEINATAVDVPAEPAEAEPSA